MKKTNTIYWIVTIIFGGFMLFSGIMNAIAGPDSIKLVHDQLGYPIYIIRFLGIAKIIGAVIILIPGFTQLKYWAYAGLMFDLIGALYSLLMIGGGAQAFFSMGIFIALGFGSYFYFLKKNSLN
jgi:hypothetical protein